jgi:hypothetical protein
MIVSLRGLFTMGGIKVKGCYFQLGPMGVNSLPIEVGFNNQNSCLAQEGEMVDAFPKEIANIKIKVLLWMEKGQKTNLNEAQEQGVTVPSSLKIILVLSGPNWQGGHGKICKM